MKRVLLIMIGVNILLHASFIRYSSGVVADNTTGLIWQDSYSENEGTIKKITWQDALVYCEELSLSGNNDWRLPNKNELFSIVNVHKDPSISSTFINIISQGGYWSSTSSASNSNYAWAVVFGHLSMGIGLKIDKGFIRCVRGGE